MLKTMSDESNLNSSHFVAIFSSSSALQKLALTIVPVVLRFRKSFSCSLSLFHTKFLFVLFSSTTTALVSRKRTGKRCRMHISCKSMGKSDNVPTDRGVLPSTDAGSASSFVMIPHGSWGPTDSERIRNHNKACAQFHDISKSRPVPLCCQSRQCVAGKGYLANRNN